MSTILLVWELGAGSGHVMHSAPLVNALVRCGHRVFAALRDPGAAVGVFDPAIALLPAPLRTDGDRGVLSFGSSTFSFARILHNTAFGEERVLAGLGAAWRNLFLEQLGPVCGAGFQPASSPSPLYSGERAG